jgi:hypothetical protein
MNSVVHGFKKITEVSGTDDQSAPAVQKVYDETSTTSRTTTKAQLDVVIIQSRNL